MKDFLNVGATAKLFCSEVIMLDGLALTCIALPILAGILVFILRASFLRGVLVVATGVVLALASLYLAKNGSFQLAADTMLGIKVDSLILVLDLALMAIILLIGLRLANWIITGLAAAQIAGVLYIEGLFGFVGGGQSLAAPMLPQMGLFADNLSLIMVLVI